MLHVETRFNGITLISGLRGRSFNSYKLKHATVPPVEIRLVCLLALLLSRNLVARPIFLFKFLINSPRRSHKCDDYALSDNSIKLRA